MIDPEKYGQLIQAYTRVYGPGSIMCMEPDGALCLVDDETDTVYKIPDQETVESFMDKLNRSRAIQGNPFYEDYKDSIVEQDPDALY